MRPSEDKKLVSTGISGLDEILCGGLPSARVYLVQGHPGVGKTTLALSFLLEGVRNGEKVLYVALSETKEELRAVAASHGRSIEGISILELAAAELAGAPLEEENTLYQPSEVELGERMQLLLAETQRIQPTRIVIDSCSELRLLAQTALRFRRQVLTLKQQLFQWKSTMLLLDTSPELGGDVLLQSLVHGVIDLEQLSPVYGAARRRLRVVKLREIDFRHGYHDFKIVRGGIVVYPRLVVAEHRMDFAPGVVSSGLADLDRLLGGGIDCGTSMLLIGQAGTGKSILTTCYALAAAQRGERAAIFNFEETIATVLQRSGTLGMPLEEHMQSGLVNIRQLDPAEIAPGEFVHMVRHAVETQKARLIVIDSLNGYLNAMPDDNHINLQLHELLTYLAHRGVVTLMVVAQHGLATTIQTPIDVSYIADSVLVLRYFEAAGRVRKAISVMKKRSGAHEDTIRELTVTAHRVSVGPALEEFRGVLTGVPEYFGAVGPEGTLRGR